MKRIVILTGTELRHHFVRSAIALAEGIEVVRSFCEGAEKSLGNLIDPTADGAALQRAHVAARARAEEDFFAPFVSLAPDHSNPTLIPKGAINEPECVAAIRECAPDLLVAYGCSLIRNPLLSMFEGRFLNVHLGLSPYYRGSGTNFWPLVNGEPEYVGATFMHIDAGVDTGRIIHQIRARVFPGDTPHQIGNRLIADLVPAYIGVIRDFDRLEDPPQPPEPERTRVYRNKDFTPLSVAMLYAAFADGLVPRYLAEREAREARAPILRNSIVMA